MKSKPFKSFADAAEVQICDDRENVDQPPVISKVTGAVNRTVDREKAEPVPEK